MLKTVSPNISNPFPTLPARPLPVMSFSKGKGLPMPFSAVVVPEAIRVVSARPESEGMPERR